MCMCFSVPSAVANAHERMEKMCAVIKCIVLCQMLLFMAGYVIE